MSREHPIDLTDDSTDSIMVDTEVARSIPIPPISMQCELCGHVKRARDLRVCDSCAVCCSGCTDNRVLLARFAALLRDAGIDVTVDSNAMTISADAIDWRIVAMFRARRHVAFNRTTRVVTILIPSAVYNGYVYARVALRYVAIVRTTRALGTFGMLHCATRGGARVREVVIRALLEAK